MSLRTPPPHCQVLKIPTSDTLLFYLGKERAQNSRNKKLHKACAKLKNSAKETFEEVHNIYRDLQPSNRTVSRWLKTFKDGRECTIRKTKNG